METNGNESFTNYGRVGFELEVDTRLAPLMLIGDCGRPNIGFGFHDGLSFRLVVGCFGLGSVQEMKMTPWFTKVSTVGFVTAFYIYLIACRPSILLILFLFGSLQVLGLAKSSMAQSFVNDS